MSNSTMNNSTQTESKFFDLHVSAFGYLNRYRVIGSGSRQFCAVTVAALRGSKDEVEYTYFDVIIRNQDVCSLLAGYAEQINDRNTKVLASVTLSDIYAETFGEPAKATIKGRLIGLKTLNIAGETVFSSKLVEAVEPASGESEQSADSVDSQMDQVVSELSSKPESDSDQLNEIIRSVRLDPSIEFYEAQKQDLMSQGYAFDSQQGLWVLYKK
jgi:hypothetical protein